MTIDKETLNLIQQAIDIEANNSYVNIHGKYHKFADFIKKQLYIIYKKNNKDIKWLSVIDCFEKYDLDSVAGRKNSIKTLINAIKAENDLTPKASKEPKTPRTLKTTDVTYIKGIGPKLSTLFNKIGIFTAYDLLTYYPKKHINYASRTLINKIKEGENVTIYGTIKSVTSYTTQKGLSILKVRIQDESGYLELNYFYAKASKYLLERYKSQFPKGLCIMVSGKAKKDKFSSMMTIDKPEHQIISADFEYNKNLNLGRIVPIYGLTENLNIKTLRKSIFNTIKEFNAELIEIIPDYLIQKYNFINKKHSCPKS